MGATGYIRMHRRVFEHPLFAGDSFSPREAWLALVAQAAWKPCVVDVEGRKVCLDRGQLVASVRFLAEQWKWGKSTVSRYLRKLEAEVMIVGTANGASGKLITICNYDEYQTVATDAGTASGTTVGHRAGHRRRKSGTAGGTAELPLTIGNKATSEAGQADAGTASGTPSAKKWDSDRDKNKKESPKERKEDDPALLALRAALDLIRPFDAELKRLWPERERLCPSEGDKSQARQWLHSGIVPAMVAEAAAIVLGRKKARGEGPPSGVAYLANEVSRLLSSKPRPAAERERDSWAPRMMRFKSGHWADCWGPAPGEAGCLMPRPLQDECLLSRREVAA